MQGEFVGINSAGSLGKSDRINSGAAYSISVNMIKNFLGQLRAGLECDHATLGADIEPENEEGGIGRLIVKRVVTGSEVDRRGLSVDDQLISFAGWPLTNINQYKNKLGIYPKGWRVPLAFRHETAERHEVLVRLPGRRPDVIPDKRRRQRQRPTTETTPPPLPPPPAGTDAAKLYREQARLRQLLFQQIGAKTSLGRLPRQGRLQRPARRLDDQGGLHPRQENLHRANRRQGADQRGQERAESSPTLISSASPSIRFPPRRSWRI